MLRSVKLTLVGEAITAFLAIIGLICAFSTSCSKPVAASTQPTISHGR